MARRGVFHLSSLRRWIRVRGNLLTHLSQIEDRVRAIAPIATLRKALLDGDINEIDFVQIMQAGGYDDAEIARQYGIIQSQKGGDQLPGLDQTGVDTSSTSKTGLVGRLPQRRPRVPTLPHHGQLITEGNLHFGNTPIMLHLNSTNDTVVSQ
jgi:hypothetical protein